MALSTSTPLRPEAILRGKYAHLIFRFDFLRWIDSSSCNECHQRPRFRN